MTEVEASDLHIKVGSPPVLRIAAVLHGIDAPPLRQDGRARLPASPKEGREMSGAEVFFVSLVIGAFVLFSATLAYVSWEYTKDLSARHLTVLLQ